MTHIQDMITALCDNANNMERFVGEIEKSLEHIERIFLVGNGGSAAIVSHAVCDLMKRGGTVPVYCLTDNTPLLTAIANDMSYEMVFSEQLRMHDFNEYDALIVVSSSGNSMNVVHAVSHALRRGGWVFGLVGHKGGRVKDAIDVNNPERVLHIPSDVYEIVEDCHAIALHDLTRLLIRKNEEESW